MKKSSNMLTGVAIGMAAGAAISAFGVMQMSGMSSHKMMKKAKKTAKKNAGKILNTAENIVSAIPKMMG